MSVIKADKVTFEYVKYNELGEVASSYKALDSLDLEIKKGEFVAILGHNGSGKSTFAKHINALLQPSSGTLYICGMDSKDEDNTLEIRKNAGMVFQNPDNQIIASVVEEDVAFGLENLGYATDDIYKGVKEALDKVGMLEYRYYSPNKLSGGQKQRVAIAGVLAMHPSCIILDESTAMLDPGGRKEIIDSIYKLNKEEHITIILITHYMEETTFADKIFVMNQGKLVMQGKPCEIFSKEEELAKIKLDVPQVTKLAFELKKKGVPISKSILTRKDLVDEIERILKEKKMVIQ